VAGARGQILGKVQFHQKFASGHSTVNGKYNLLNPLWFRGLLTVKITEEQVIITALGVKVWGAAITDVSSIQIQPKVLGASVIVTSKDGMGFLFMVNDITNLVNSLKGLNLPLQYDEKALRMEEGRFKIASNPMVLTIAFILGAIFIIFIVLNVLQYQK
jgi:hypothetical protein